MKELFYLPVIRHIMGLYKLTKDDAIKLYKEFLKFYKTKPFNKNIYKLFKNFMKQPNTGSNNNTARENQTTPNNNAARTSQNTTGAQGKKTSANI